MQVKKNTLLLLACLVWTAAGVNILRIGLLAYATQVSLPHILLLTRSPFSSWPG